MLCWVEFTSIQLVPKHDIWTYLKLNLSQQIKFNEICNLWWNANDMVGVFFLISRLYIMRTSTHESKISLLIHTIIRRGFFTTRNKKHFVLLLCYINKFLSFEIKTHNMKQKKERITAFSITQIFCRRKLC